MTERFNPYAAPDRPRPIVDHRSRGRWRLAYLSAMLAGALILCSCLVLAIRDESFDGPGPGGMILFLFAFASIFGAVGGFVPVAIVHMIWKALRSRETGNLGNFGRDVGDGF